jgi:hypothetical protein
MTALRTRRLRRQSVVMIAAVATLIVVSSATAGIRSGHYHATAAKGQHADLFITGMSVSMGYVIVAHCTDQTDPLLGDFSGIKMQLRATGSFSFKQTQNGTSRRITGKLNGSVARVRVHVGDMLNGALCTGTTTFHARYVGPV